MAIDIKSGSSMNNDSLNVGSDLNTGLGSSISSSVGSDYSSSTLNSDLNSDINSSSAASPADRNGLSFNQSSQTTGAQTMGAGMQTSDIGTDQSRSQGFQSSLHSGMGQSDMGQSRMGQQNPIDAVPDAVGQVVDSIFRALQPRIHDAVTQFANRAVGVSDQSARQLVSSARRNPWYTVGGVALLVVGLGLVLGLENRSRTMAPHEFH